MGRRLRVLHVGKYFPPFRGGMEVFLKDLTDALERLGVECEVLVHKPSGPRRQRSLPGSLKVRMVPSLGEVLFTPVSPGFPVALLAAVLSFKPNIVHLHLPNVSAFWSLLLPERLLGRTIIQWQSDVIPSLIEPRLRLAYRFYRPLETILLSKASVIIASSRPYLDSSLTLRPWIGKCRAVPLGLDPTRLTWPGSRQRFEAERSWGEGGHLRVLAVGRLTYYKGFDILLEASRLLRDVRVQIVGDGALRRPLEEKTRKLGLEEKVSFRGELEDEKLQALFVSAHCLCLPSVERTEAFGMVLLEAMHYGLSIVASDIGGSGVGWVASQSPKATLVTPGEPVALAEALNRIHPAAREAVYESSSLPSIFHIDHCALQIQEIYHEIALKRVSWPVISQ